MAIHAKQVAFGLGGLVVAGSAIALYAMWSAEPGFSTRNVVNPSGDPSLAAIERTIYDYRASWDPRARERWLEEQRGRVDDLAPRLQQLLERDGHPMRVDGLAIVTDLSATSLRETVVGLASDSDPKVRAAAIETADSLEPWSEQFVLEFLRDEATEVRVAAVRVAAKRDDAPWRDVFACLTDESAEVRDAVAEAIPEGLPEDAVDALLELSRYADGEAAVAAIRALGRGRNDERTEAVLVRFLEDPDAEVIVAAIHALSAGDRPLSDSRPLLDLALDGSRQPEVRSAALRCLESNGDYDPEELLDNVSSMGPWTRYFTARCLLRKGHRGGTDVLLDLIEDTPDGARVDMKALRETDDAKDCSIAARRLLAWLTGLGPSATRAEFARELFDAAREVSGQGMPAAPPR